jgi:hypothetical protein
VGGSQYKTGPGQKHETLKNNYSEMAGGVAEVVEYFREALSSNLNTTNKKKKCSFDMIGNMM